jgi:hypothetical protein
MTKEQAKSVALFFYFAFPMDHNIVKIALNTISECRRQYRREKKSGDVDTATIIVFHTFRFWKKYKKTTAGPIRDQVLEAGWQFPKDLDMGPWKQFRKDADEEELVTLIWSHILGFSDEQIARGLGISVGSVRYRAGNGLRKLGALMWSGGTLG